MEQSGQEAFLLSDAYLFQDSPGAPIRLAILVSASGAESIDSSEITIPHETHATATGDVVELTNRLLLRLGAGGWEYDGWVY